MKLNKKGNWVDVFELGGVAVGLGIVIVIVFILLSNFDTQFNTLAQNNTMLNDSDALGYSDQAKSSFPSVADAILPLIFIFFLGFSVWSARKIPSSYLFIFIGVILMVIAFLFAMMIETVWQEFATQSAITSFISSFPVTNFILNQLRFFVLFYSLSVGVALYSKSE